MNKKSKIRVSAIILVVSVISIISITSAKYIYNSAWSYYLKSREFYFESNLLDINTKKNSLLTWDGSDISLELKNNENDELVSEYDISYNLTCSVEGNESRYIDCVFVETQKPTFTGVLSSSSKCINIVDDVDVSSFSKAECELGGYNWKKEKTTKEIKLNLILKDETKTIDEVTIKVVAESTKPYKKTLTGFFYLNKLEELESEYIVELENFTEYDELMIINKTDTDKCYFIKFNSDNYKIDYGVDSIINYENTASENINEIKVKIPKNNNSFYKFYKSNDIVSSIEDFEIVEEDC